jgi:hypothetical protein
MTASLIVEIFKELLRRPAPSAQEVASKVSEKLRRTEEARIYAWHKQTKSYPPPRPQHQPRGFHARK